LHKKISKSIASVSQNRNENKEIDRQIGSLFGIFFTRNSIKNSRKILKKNRNQFLLLGEICYSFLSVFFFGTNGLGIFFYKQQKFP
jgi:hypothetical protein